MMKDKYICLECGHEFEDPDVWQEYRGDFWGVPAYEYVSGCPICHGDYDNKNDDLEDKEREENERK